MKHYLIVIEGPTAVGKTQLSIEIAEYFKTEIISCDSRQFYKEMIIGTAIPSKSNQKRVPHHFIHQLSIHDFYSVGQFEKDALKSIKKIHKKNNIAIMVGGSGLFVDAVCKGLAEIPDIPKEIRENLNKRFKIEGLSVLKKELKKLDPVSYAKIDTDNKHRIIRALEVYIGTGKPFSSYKRKSKKIRPFKIIKIALELDRKILYNRINKRVDLMMKNGFLEEVKSLLIYKDKNALKTLGYNELFAYLQGKTSIEKAVEEIKKNSRRYAKRQITWLRRETKDLIVSPDQKLKILNFINKKIIE